MVEGSERHSMVSIFLLAGNGQKIQKREGRRKTADCHQGKAQEVIILHSDIMPVIGRVGVVSRVIGIQCGQQVIGLRRIRIIGRQGRDGIQVNGFKIRIVEHGIALQAGVPAVVSGRIQS